MLSAELRSRSLAGKLIMRKSRWIGTVELLLVGGREFDSNVRILSLTTLGSQVPEMHQLEWPVRCIVS